MKNYFAKQRITTLLTLSILFVFHLKDHSLLWAQEEFSPHMIDHMNAGCPTNSTCSKEAGLKYKRWVDFLKHLGPKVKFEEQFKNYIKDNLYPFKVWLSPPFEATNIISWDSPCEHHRKEDFQADQGLVLVQDLKASTLKKIESEYQGKVHLEKIHLWQNNKLQERLIPRGEIPVKLIDKSLFFSEEEEGIYFGFSLSEDGSFSITSPPKNLTNNPDIPCPKELIEEMGKKTSPNKLYLQYFCKNLPSNGKDQIIMILPQACVL